VKGTPFLSTLIFVVSASITACAGKTAQAENRAGRQLSWETAKEGDEGVVSGTIRRVGNEPFTYLILTDADKKNWRLDKDAQRLLRAYEMKRVRISGVVTLRKRIFADGKRLPDLKELTHVKILD